MSATLAALPISPSLTRTLDRALAYARRERSSTLATHVEALAEMPDPLAFLAAGVPAGGIGTYWSQPRHGLTFAGVGSAQEVTADGSERFAHIGAAFRQIQDTLVGHEPGTPFPIFCGFAFAEHASRPSVWREFPNSRLVVPSALLQIDCDRALLRLTQQVHPGDTLADLTARATRERERCRTWLAASRAAPSLPDIAGTLAIPDRQGWQTSVASATALIARGTVDKVVLAREEQVLACSEWPTLDTLSRLANANGNATLFGMQAGQSWFVGATPERLVRLRDGRVEVSCLAGSIAVGASDADNQRQAARLLASAKDREEHEIVVRSTMQALSAVCERVTRGADSPRVVAARSVLHLETPLVGTLTGSATVLDLVARLHPTPAVGGYPRAAALDIIRDLEAIDRGWYAGPIGWVDIAGAGDFAVALRSALLSGRTASLFAGSGIVRDSDPAAEFAETRLKLAPMRAALGCA